MHEPRIASVWYDDGFFEVILGGESTTIHTPQKDLYKYDLIVFWGGEDIHPSLYGEKIDGAHCGKNPSPRDLSERAIWKQAIEMDLPMIGICRGAQMLCALNGGKLWQDVDGHGRSHFVTMTNGEQLMVTSTHHQMMIPSKDMEVIGVSTNNESRWKLNATGRYKAENPEPEIVYHYESGSLMIQGHPEYSYATTQFVEKTRNLIKWYTGL